MHAISCHLLGTVLYLCDPIPGNLMQTLLHLTPYISNSVFKICVLKSDMISSCYRGSCCILPCVQCVVSAQPDTQKCDVNFFAPYFTYTKDSVQDICTQF